jgi:major membrane immunogen (membrane-anchored lipoprotein)
MDAKDKSFIETNISITIKGRNVTKRVKFKNKKGTLKQEGQA